MASLSAGALRRHSPRGARTLSFVAPRAGKERARDPGHRPAIPRRNGVSGITGVTSVRVG